ncbi:MAG: hypothetical protein DRP74_02120 [Candidatus Omnitrophota bacterium]|nr:MAG: hypothetical protein DRP74_02120 [Candidatus Omnitrophota bacterium]
MDLQIQLEIIKTLQNASWLTFFIVFWGAALLSMSSCTIVRVPIVIGYISGTATTKKRAFLLTLTFVSALVLTYTSLGIVFGLLVRTMDYMISWSRYFYYIIGGLALFIGVQMAGLVNFKFPWLNKFKNMEGRRKGLLGAFLFGFIFAIFEAPTCPCCGPVLFIIASLTFAKGEILYGIMLFFVYALGQSLPILLIGSFTSIVKYISPKVHKIEEWLRLLSGSVLIVVAIYFFIAG